MRTSIRAAIVLAAFVSLLGPAASSSAASRAVPDRSGTAAAPVCVTNSVCAWTETGFTGSKVTLPHSVIGVCWEADGGQAFNSVLNASAGGIHLWEFPFCTGRVVIVPPGGGQPVTPFPVRSFTAVLR
jgi:hypothetical protein